MNKRTDLDGLDRYIGLGYEPAKLATMFDFDQAFIAARKTGGGWSLNCGIYRKISTELRVSQASANKHPKPAAVGSVSGSSQKTRHTGTEKGNPSEKPRKA